VVALEGVLAYSGGRRLVILTRCIQKFRSLQLDVILESSEGGVGGRVFSYYFDSGGKA
jgi:hypothetical protein